MVKPTRPADGGAGKFDWHQWIHDAVVPAVPDGGTVAPGPSGGLGTSDGLLAGDGAGGVELVGRDTYALDEIVRPVLGLDSILHYDTFNRADQTGLGTTDSGQAWTTVHANGLDIVSNKATATGTGTRANQFEAGSADVAMWARAVLQSTVGLVFRGDLSGTDYLYVGLSTSALSITKREGNIPSTLATTAVTAVTGQTYRMSLVASSDRISATAFDLSGRELGSVTHQLSAGDQTTYGSATKVGVAAFNASGATWDDLVVRSA